MNAPQPHAAPTLDHWIGGAAVPPAGGRYFDDLNPLDDSLYARAADGNAEDVERAVQAADAAFPAFRKLLAKEREALLQKAAALLERDRQDFIDILIDEVGSPVMKAGFEVGFAIGMLRAAAGVPRRITGQTLPSDSPERWSLSLREPLGVVAGITPFNFPAMIPMWMFGMACAAGNAFILKPSERDPSVPVRLAELFLEAGAPEGLLQVVHGDKEMVDAILDHPDIPAISFVGSSDIAHYIYHRGAQNAKRVQAFGGAKNHGIVMPDADLDHVVNDLAGAAFGSAGERCMALPVVVPVGEDTANALREKLIPAINALRVGVSTDPDAHYGPVVTPEHKARVEQWITTAEEEGGEIVVDGRGFSLQGHENGFFVGPTLIDHVTPQMKSYQEEIFGPVLQIVRARDFEDAVRLPSEHQYGNGVAIFTRNGHAAREFASRVNVGMVGVNVPIPVPVSYHSFGGWKRSGFGDIDQYGMEGLKFWTKNKKITQRWPDGGGDGSNAFIIPTMG